MTRVLVIGCGAIGSLVAGHLARLDDVQVHGFDVARAHVEAVRSAGLVVQAAESFTVHPHLTVDPAELPPCDLAIVATKSEHTAAAVGAVLAAGPALADAAVASVQNGVGNEEVLAGLVPRVIRGSTLLAGSLPEPGRVRLDATGDTWLGPFEDQPATTAEVARLADLLQRSGLGAHALADARGPQWTKLVFNAATNAVGALTGLTIGQIGTSPQLADLVAGLIAEGRDVAAAQGIEVGHEPEDLIADAVRRAYGHRASMLQDVQRRRRTEVDVLNGGIVTAGARVGIPTPLHAAVAALVRGLELSWDPPRPSP